MDEQLRYIPEPEGNKPVFNPGFVPVPQKQPESADDKRTSSQTPPPEKKTGRFAAFILALIALGLLVSYPVFVRPPSDFPKDTVVTVSAGETLSGVAETLDGKNMIRSKFAFKALVVLFAGPRGLQAGDYYFENPQNVLAISWRLSHAAYGLKNVRVTIPEGLSVRQIARIFADNPKFTHWNEREFMKLALPKEGYLFPDTYFLLPNVTAEDVFAIMTENYKRRIASVQAEIKAFGKSEKDVITMASILEEEGRTMETREMIAGILWKRLAQGIPLQVDASVVYATEKTSGKDLIPDDFKFDSPYNSYLYKGLPPTPISNPGLDAIRAAVHPTASRYLYYITDPEGGFHPAVTYEEQLANEAKYLK